MKLVKKVIYRCNAIVQPGEYVIDRWDNRRCETAGARHLAKCESCEDFFCLTLHWPKHDCTEE